MGKSGELGQFEDWPLREFAMKEVKEFNFLERGRGRRWR